MGSGESASPGKGVVVVVTVNYWRAVMRLEVVSAGEPPLVACHSLFSY